MSDRIRFGLALTAIIMGAISAPAAGPTADDTTNAIPVLSARYPVELPYSDPDGGTMTFTLIDGPSRGYLEYSQWNDFEMEDLVSVPLGIPIGSGQWFYTSLGANPGADSFTWQVCDGTTTSAVATMTFLLITNTAVTSGPSTNTIAVGSIRNDITMNYTDPDEYQPKSVQLVTPPSRGALEYGISDTNWVPIVVGDWVQNVDWCYTPSGMVAGTDSFQWRITDGIATSDVSTVTIVITTNSPPSAQNQSFSAVVGVVQWFIWLSFTDRDENQPLKFQLMTPPSRGTLESWIATNISTIAAGEWIDVPFWFYTPSGVVTGSDNFTWRVSDGMSTSGVATVSITLTSNNVPVANNQSVNLVAGAVRKQIALSFSHADIYQPMRYLLKTPPAHGVLECMSDTNYVAISTNTSAMDWIWYYTEDLGYLGPDSFQWCVSDGISTAGVVTCNVTITTNRTPVAYGIRATVSPGASVSLDAKFTDPDSGQTWTASILKSPDHGILTQEDMTFSYTPTGGFQGVDFFTYKVSDGEDDSNEAIGRIQVRDANDRAGSLVLLVVNDTLLPNISNEVIRLWNDLLVENYTAKIYAAPATITTSNLWSYLRGEYDNTNQWLTGAILIGNLPKPYLDSAHKTDLVYWNMNLFQTVGSVNDFHIWVSRIYASELAYGNEVDLIKRALEANHEYRNGISRLPHKAYYYHAWNSYPYGTNLLQVWPSVAMTNEPTTTGYSAVSKFLPWRTDISCAGADALVAGGDVYQETSHGNASCYMNATFLVSDLFRLGVQQRSCIIESCTSGDYGGIANQHLFTRGGGCILAVGGTEINYVGDFQTASPYGDAPTFRTSLGAGESWGNALLKNFIFSARNSIVFYGDLSMPAKVGLPNEAPMVTSLTATATIPLPGQSVTFSIAISDVDAGVTNSPFVDFQHQVEWFPEGYDGGQKDPTCVTNSNGAGWTNFTYVYSTAGVYTTRVEVMDEWKARGWREITFTVDTPPIASNDTSIVEANQSIVIPVLANDSDPDGQSLTIDSIVMLPAHGTVARNGDLLLYTSTNAWQGVDTFTYRIKDTLNVMSTGQVSVTVVSDTTGPKLVRTWSWGDSNVVQVLYSEPVKAGSADGGAESPARYSLNYGVNVTGAELQADTRTVKLTTSGLKIGLDYILTVNEVLDRAVVPNAILPNTQSAFQYLPANVVVWVEDTIPGGGETGSSNGDGWDWITFSPTPFSGTTAHQSSLYSAEHQHYFQNTTQTLTIATGNVLFVYVYLDPANVPQELMLQFGEESSWEHRAYWGQNLIPWGTNNTVTRQYMGALPKAGQWVRLEVPVESVGLEGLVLNGMSFSLYGGRATWDMAGNCSGTFHPVVDGDGDGMPDNWEIERFGNTGVSDGSGDADRDGMSDHDEWWAGTNPNERGSVLAIECETSGANATLFWPSVAGRSYSLVCGTNLLSGLNTIVASNLVATPSINVYTDMLNNAESFYRVKVETE